MTHQELVETVARYLQRFPEDKVGLQLLLEQLSGQGVMNDHTNFVGHITAGALVLSPDLTKIVLIKHAFYGMWLQPGGHWESDEADPLLAAQREAIEETAVAIDRYIALDVEQPLIPIHIQTHPVASRPSRQQPAHFHHDFKYVFVAAS